MPNLLANLCFQELGKKKKKKIFITVGNAVFNKDLAISNSFNNENVATLASVFWLSDMDNTVSSVKDIDSAQVTGNAHIIMKASLVFN